MDHRQETVRAFCAECVWARAVRAPGAELFESGSVRPRLSAEIAKTIFHDLNVVLLEYVLLQQCKLTDPATSEAAKDNLTTNYILALDWSDETRVLLAAANHELMEFRTKINDAQRKLVSHSDLRSATVHRTGSVYGRSGAGILELQRFVDAAHMEACAGPFEIAATMPDGDAASLIHGLVDAIDYNDLIEHESGFVMSRVGKRRYEGA